MKIVFQNFRWLNRNSIFQSFEINGSADVPRPKRRVTFNPGLALFQLWTTGPSTIL